MDDVEPQIAEALILVLNSLVRTLAENGAIRPEQLSTAESAFRMQSEATLIPQKKANTAEAADIMQILAMVAKREKLTGAHLRLVPTDGEEPDAQ